jgi:hypothetical protein
VPPGGAARRCRPEVPPGRSAPRQDRAPGACSRRRARRGVGERPQPTRSVARKTLETRREPPVARAGVA